MNGDLTALSQKVDALGVNVSGINTELKQVNKLLTNLIRIDGNIMRVEEKVDRIGVEKDDHEARIRALESKSGKLFDQIVGYVLSAGLGGGVVLIVTKVLT